ncbi:helix-turn-helix domain-containing protein [Streptomyces sp. NPDC001868]|uniref:AraC-like ligand-binding domain-containing protein n=1 Tax=Streptomyces sp. NPDC001868 TaxID=3154401 RepID=UPI003324E374
MLVTEISTSRLPAAERFDYWRAMTADTLTPDAQSSDHTSDFRAELRLLLLGAVRVGALTYPSLQTRRTNRLIRQSDPENYQLTLTVSGRHRIIQAGRDTTSTANDLLLYDTSRPWHGWAAADSTAVRGITVQFPRRLLPLPQATIKSLAAVCLPGDRGVAGLLNSFLRQIVTDAASYTPADTSRLAKITIDLMAAACAHHFEAEQRLPPETHHHVLSLRIHAFIEEHLSDVDLTPTVIAAAHNISTRHLHRIFHTTGMTVAGWIRRRRLENCSRDLADPRHANRPIHAVAARWGFPDKAHFSRVFHSAYGVSPSEYRRELTGPTSHASSTSGP